MTIRVLTSGCPNTFSSVLTSLLVLLCLQEVISLAHNDILPQGRKLEPKPTHFILAPSRIRPSELVQVVVAIFELPVPEVTVHVIIRRDQNAVAGVSDRFKHSSTKTLQMKVPEWMSAGNYSLRVEGVTPTGGYLFVNETHLDFHPKHVSVFIQTSKWFYQKRQTVHFRIIALTQNLLPVKMGSIHIFIKDPGGRVIRRWVSKQLLQGVYEGEMPLGHPISNGWWTIIVEGFGYQYTQQFITENDFQERIEMNLTAPAYVKQHEYALAGLLMSNLTSGHPVKGSANVTLQVEPVGFKGDRYPTITRRIPYFEGVTSFMFPLEEIRNLTSLPVGSRLKLSAVADDFFYSGELPAVVESEVFSSDIYIRFIGGSVRTFKPKVPFTVYVAVYEADGVPLSSITNRILQLHITWKLEGGRTSSISWEVPLIIPNDGIVTHSITPGSDVTNMRIRARYGGAGTAGQTMELAATRHVTRSGHYLSITTSTEAIQADHYMVLTITCTAHIPNIHYVVMTGGRILYNDIIYMMARQKTFALAVSREMIPESRLIVYGILGDGEVLTDSISFYVTGIRNDGVQVKLNKGKDFSLETVEMTGLTDPGTFIAFSTQDYDFYRRGGNREHQANIFFTTHAIEQDYLSYSDHVNTSFTHTWYEGDSKLHTVHYTSPSHAIDANSTFVFCGLTVITDAYLGRIQNAWVCNSTLGFLPCYDGTCYLIEQGCDGVRQCADGADEMGCQDPSVVEPRRPGGLDVMWRLWLHLDLATWGWKSHFTKPDGRIDLRAEMPLRPTIWVVGAFSLHPEKGLAFNEHPARVDTTRPFFLVIESEKSAVRGEQLGIRVAAFNYHSEPLEVLLTLVGSPDYRFIQVPPHGYVRSYDPDTTSGSIQTMIYLRSQESRLVYFPVLPTKTTGKITVTVTGETPIARATVTKTIKLRMDGIRNIYHSPYFVNLVSQGSVLVPDMEIPVPEMFYHPEQREHLYVPGSATCTVTLVGDVMGPGLTSTHLTMGEASGTFYGDGEHHVFNMAYNMNWLRFLKITNQISDTSLQQVLENMNKELMNIAAFLMPSGGVSNRRQRSKESVWITGFTLETLAFAAEPEYEAILYIDVDMLNQMALWLVKQQNKTTGAVHNEAEYFDVKMQSNLTDSDDNKLYIQETAYAIIGLSQAQEKLTGEAQSAAEACRQRGAEYLAGHLKLLTDPFHVCLVAMALHVADHRAKGRAFNVMRGMKRQAEFVYWSPEEIPPDPTEIVNTVPFRKARPVSRPAETSAVQATGYALILHLRNNLFTEAEPIMQWLQSQRRHYQFFGSSQDTIVAMQALREYGEGLANRDLYNMKVDIEATSTPSAKQTILLKRGNFHNFNIFKVPIVHGHVKVEAVGTGLALLQMRTEVNVEYPWQLRNPDERSYDLTIDRFFFYGRNSSNFYMKICFSWMRTDLGPYSGSTLLEVGIPSGFYVRKNLLREEQRNGGYLIKRARYTGHHVILYIDKVGPSPRCVEFSAERWWPVANGTIQHLVQIRDMSNPAFQNLSMYTTYDLFHLHICQVCGSFQCPYCPFYNRGQPVYNTKLQFMMLMLTVLVSLLWPRIFIKPCPND